jgi:hypothetical integral membrane protein (TIGR02206 family)
MRPYIQLFGPAHLVILAAVPLFAAILAFIQRAFLAGAKSLRLVFAVLLLLDTIVFYRDQIMHGQISFPGHMPLELCDLSLVLVFLSLLTLNRTVFDLAYYLGLGGASMALITPNLWEPFPSFGTVQFFVAHGLTVAGVLFLVWSGLARPRRGSIGRAMLGLNVFAAVAGAFDAAYRTDYMYLRTKPANASLLSVMGPWPWYIRAAEVLALVIFTLLYLPFRKQAANSEEIDMDLAHPNHRSNSAR